MTVNKSDEPQASCKAGKEANAIRCLNCDKPLDLPKLYCSEVCAQEAEFVRYVRRCRRTAREKIPDVKEAIEIRLAHLLGGGYAKQERQLSATVRNAVIARDNGLCKQCGKPGNQIDHISGSSRNLDNLQLLCRSCHDLKTRASMVKVTPDLPDWEKCNTKAIALMNRIFAKKPKRVCDDDKTWPSVWRGYLQERKQVFSELEADLECGSPLEDVELLDLWLQDPTALEEHLASWGEMIEGSSD